MSARPETADKPELPPPPERPDCCFGGCAQCVLDDYAEAMARWQQACEEIEQRHAAANHTAPDRGTR